MDIEHVRNAANKLKEAMDMFGRGPLDYYLRELVAAHDLLMSRFAPFQIGDRVKLLKSPDYEKAPGWDKCKHFLVCGAAGVIVDATCGSSGFVFDVLFDDESWIDTVGRDRPKGSVVPMPGDRKHRFGFREGWLEHVTPNVEVEAIAAGKSPRTPS